MPAFVRSIRDWIDGVWARLDSLPRRVSAEVAVRLVGRSPVATGRFVANWQVSIDGAATPYDPTAADPGKSDTVARLAAELASAPAHGSIAVVNPAPYATALEYGTLGRPPSAMLRPTLRELPAIVAEAAEREP